MSTETEEEEEYPMDIYWDMRRVVDADVKDGDLLKIAVLYLNLKRKVVEAHHMTSPELGAFTDELVSDYIKEVRIAPEVALQHFATLIEYLRKHKPKKAAMQMFFANAGYKLMQEIFQRTKEASLNPFAPTCFSTKCKEVGEKLQGCTAATQLGNDRTALIEWLQSLPPDATFGLDIENRVLRCNENLKCQTFPLAICIFNVGDTVLVVPKDDDLFSQEFVGRITSITRDYYCVADQDSDVYACEVDQIRHVYDGN